MRNARWIAKFGDFVIWRRCVMWCSAIGCAVAMCSVGAAAQAPGRGAAAPPASAAKLDANMAQLMRGILYPASNVLFAAQEDLSKQPKAADAAVSPNPLTSTYGG